jgi:hypothetical protein
MLSSNLCLLSDLVDFNVQASFLSLSLHALAEKLANIDLSQRLFIEADLLPSELVCLISHCDVENHLVTVCKQV